MRSVPEADGQTFVGAARRRQLVDVAIATIAEVGYAATTLQQVADRAGVSKGVVSYHFAGRDALVDEVVAEVFARIGASVHPRLAEAATARDFVRAYLLAWTGFYREHRAEMLAIGDIWTSLRTASGRTVLGPATLEPELSLVAARLAEGQRAGELRPFDPRVAAVSLKGALDALLTQLAADPHLDVDRYGEHLADLFDAAFAASTPRPTRSRKERSR